METLSQVDSKAELDQYLSKAPIGAFDTKEWKDFIFNLVCLRKDSFVQIIRSRLTNVHVHVESTCYGTKAIEKIYNFVFDNPERRCKVCSEGVKFVSFSLGYRKYCSRKCSRNDPSTLEKQKQTNLKRHGVEHVMHCASVKDAYASTMIERYGSECPFSSSIIKRKIRESKLKSGSYIRDEDKSEFEIYKKKVVTITNQQPLHVLQNYDKRGQCRGFFSLDHKYSIKRGFIDKIDPEVIGSLVNLEYIEVSKNSSKQERCSIGKEELFDSFHKYKRN